MLEINAAQPDYKNKDIGKEVNNLLNETSAVISEQSAEVRNRGAEVLKSALTKTKELQASAIENGKKVVRNTDGYVKNNPWRAITISAGAGVLLGLILKSRNS